MSSVPYHTPVLLDEALSFLLSAPPGTFVDATLGGGGHAEALLNLLGPTARLIGLDADADAINAATARLQYFGDRFVAVRENFDNLQSVLADLGVPALSGILFDLGVSSSQFDQPEKGFSFRLDERLDMRMNQTQSLDAQTVLNTYSAEELEEIFRKYGEERSARRIAKTVIQRRKTKKIQTSKDLVSVVESIVGDRHRVKSLARIFQAVRIEVNNELERLDRALRQALNALQPGGRVAVISYHSLEDRIVKAVFKGAAATSLPSGTKLLPDKPIQPSIELLTRKPVKPSAEEIRRNPRSRSAKLRAARKL
ncbi:MAG: 16S rRNA (cytosine(1402)-N(4))-methyltransferase RsmH [Ignavibacteriales bacterium]|nr:16S rRNA (cytosine(1402)-N(4))-methyltransferase RsmH [Ignavibacteriales bacterium]